MDIETMPTASIRAEIDDRDARIAELEARAEAAEKKFKDEREHAAALQESMVARLRAALEWVVTKAQQTSLVEGRGAMTVAEYFQMYVYLPVRLEKSEFEMLQAALRTDEHPPESEGNNESNCI